jgi:hypothetical protein
MILIFAMELSSESESRRAQLRRTLTSPQNVRPYRHVWAQYIAPGGIQSLMPVVEFLVVCTLEACAAEPEDLNVVARAGTQLAPPSRKT